MPGASFRFILLFWPFLTFSQHLDRLSGNKKLCNHPVSREIGSTSNNLYQLIGLMSFSLVFAIGVGGFFGAVSRYLVAGKLSLWLNSPFPFGTLVVNALGSFLLGFLSRFLIEHVIVEETIRIGILVGFLGAFTTFSTFSYESLALLQEGDIVRASANILGSAIICITLCLLGLHLAKSI